MRFGRFGGALAGSLMLATILSGCESKVPTLTPEVQAGMLKDLQARRARIARAPYTPTAGFTGG